MGDQGAADAGPSLMDELRAEEEALDRAAAEADLVDADMQELEADLASAASSGRGRRKGGKKGGGKGGGAASREDPAEVEAYLRYNDREGLFNLLEEAAAYEAALEQQVEASPDGSKERLEAVTELGRVRAAQSEEVAEFMHQYNPVRVSRNKEESLDALGLGHLPAPADIVADVEKRFEKEKKQLKLRACNGTPNSSSTVVSRYRL